MIMSDIIVLKKSIEASDLSALARVVMQYLIERTNKARECFPSVPTIAEKCNLSERSVQRKIKELVEKGFLKKFNQFRSNQSQTSNLYVLNVVPQAAPEEPKGLSKQDSLDSFSEKESNLQLNNCYKVDVQMFADLGIEVVYPFGKDINEVEWEGKFANKFDDAVRVIPNMENAQEATGDIVEKVVVSQDNNADAIGGMVGICPNLENGQERVAEKVEKVVVPQDNNADASGGMARVCPILEKDQGAVATANPTMFKQLVASMRSWAKRKHITLGSNMQSQKKYSICMEYYKPFWSGKSSKFFIDVKISSPIRCSENENTTLFNAMLSLHGYPIGTP